MTNRHATVMILFCIKKKKMGRRSYLVNVLVVMINVDSYKEKIIFTTSIFTMI
jgi:hypothetical protein